MILPVHDNTMLGVLDRCPRLYQIQFPPGEKGRSPGGSSAALDYGDLMHQGLYTWYRTQDKAVALATMEAHPFPEPEIGDDRFRTKERALQKLSQYMDYYEAKDRERWIIHENERSIEVEADGIRYGGRTDLVVEEHGKLWVVDHKTTSRFMGWETYRRSPQFRGYAWALSHLYGRRVHGAIVNVIVTHKVPKPPETQLKREYIMYEEWEIEEWLQGVQHRLKAVERMVEDDYFPPNLNNCVNKYGKCPALAACQAPEKDRQAIIEEDFSGEQWDWRLE